MGEPPQQRGLGADRFGGRLIAAMQLRGNYKATALASALNVNEATISRWKRSGPITLEHAIRLCEALDVSMDWLFRGIGHPASAARLPTPGGETAAAVTQRAVDEMRALLVVIEAEILRRAQANGHRAQG